MPVLSAVAHVVPVYRYGTGSVILLMLYIDMWRAWTVWSRCSDSCGTVIQVWYRKYDSLNVYT